MLEESKALEINCYAAGAGAFGIFVRWMQLMIARDDEGLFLKGSFWNFAIAALLIAGIIVFKSFVKKFKKEKKYVPGDFCEALKNEGKIFKAARLFIGGLMIAGALLLLAKCETDKNAVFLQILAVLGVISGAAFPLVLEMANRPHNEHRGLAAFLSAMPVIMFAFWLVTCYKQNSISSVAWQYVTEIAAVSFAMIGFFRAAGFAFGAPDWAKAMPACMTGAMFCIMSLADDRYMGQQIMFAAAALMLLMYNWLMIENMKQKKKGSEEQSF